MTVEQIDAITQYKRLSDFGREVTTIDFGEQKREASVLFVCQDNNLGIVIARLITPNGDCVRYTTVKYPYALTKLQSLLLE